jgi:hypothetical protein
VPVPSSGRPRILTGATAGVVLVVLVLVLIALTTGGDDDDLRIVRGAPTEGFPLRGDLAGDDALLRDAARAWQRRVERDGDRWRKGDEVVALWAGRAGDDDAVVLAASHDAVLVTRDRDREDEPMSVSRASTIGDAERPLLVAFQGAVLVRDGTDPVFRRAETEGAGSPEPRTDAGLLHRGLGTSLPAGALLFPDGVDPRLTRGDELALVQFTGQQGGLRRVSPSLLRRLTSGEESRPGPAAQRLRAAALAATPSGEGERSAPLEPFEAPRLDLAAERTLGPVGRVLVLRAAPAYGSGSRSRRPRVVAATGGSSVAGRDTAVAFGLGTASPTGVGQAPLGPALGATYVRDPAGSTTPYLLVAGDRDVRRLQVLAGGRSFDAEAGLALVRATRARTEGSTITTAADVAVLGRTAGGRVVVPSAAGDAPVDLEP